MTSRWLGWTENPTGHTAHRPWPLPTDPWIMAQRWNDLLFAHWPVPVDVMRPLVPASLPLDTFDGSAWVSIAAFTISRLRARWMPPLPGLSTFPELNVRTYTSLGGKPGVYFFTLDAGSAAAVEAARLFYHLPYVRADMRSDRDARSVVTYFSRRTDRRAQPAEFRARYRPLGDVEHTVPGSLDHWLTERYCLYAVDAPNRVYRAEIHHRPWPLRPAEAEIDTNTMLTAIGLTISSPPERVAFSSSIDVAVWMPHRIA